MPADRTTAPSKIRKLTDGGQVFFCPGCDDAHALHPGIWAFNGDATKPTFSPSILFRTGHYVPGEEGKPCWCSFEQRTGRKPPKFGRCRICHSFVREGMIQFLNDCTHRLAGQTVPVPDWPYAPGTYGGIEDAT